MQKNRKMLEDLLDANETVEDNAHPDRRKNEEENEADRRKHNRKGKKIV